jgi:putative NADPH-quinone reductase
MVGSREGEEVRVLLVVAHPDAGSFTHACATTATTTLRDAGHHVDVLDLYALGVRAAMSADERVAYEGDSPLVDPLIAEHAALVQQAEALVFAYPTWWSSFPAILKGWLDRVMTPGVSFVFDERRIVRPGLRHVRHIVGLTSYGSPRAYVRLVNDNGRRILTRMLRLNTAWKAKVTWLGLHAIDTSTDERRAAHLRRIERTMRALR